MSDEEELPCIALSGNHRSHDLQVFDALNWLCAEHTKEADKVLSKFPEMRRVVETFDAQPDTETHLNTEQAGVDPEYTSWLTDALEETGLVWWEDGEPWTRLRDPMVLVWVDPSGTFGHVDDLRFVRVSLDELHTWNNGHRSGTEIAAFAVANGLPFEAMAKGWRQPSD